MKLNKLGFALSGGIIWSLALCVLTIISISTGYGKVFLGVIADIYPGYSITVPGLFAGMLYAFADAFFGFLVFAWLYNTISGRLSKG